MSDELMKILRNEPDEIAKQILKDIMLNGQLYPWTSLNIIKESVDMKASPRHPEESLRTLLTQVLDQLSKTKPIHAKILHRIYWERIETVKVGWWFSEERNYAKDSGTFYKWYKEARYDFGKILLQIETLNQIENSSVPLSSSNQTSLKQSENERDEITVLSTLTPLEPEQRILTRTAQSVSSLGITLFRYLPVFEYEFNEMLGNGGKLRIVLIDPRSTALEMSSLRSEWGTPVEIQKQRIEHMLELLSRWKANIPGADIEVRLLKHFPPYGITVIHPKSDTQNSYCLVRIYTFRTSTSTAPSVKPDPVNDTYWFEFFCDQFEKMWEYSDPYKL